MINWNKRPDEMEEEYIYRIGLAKEQIGSWQDVADILNEQLGHEYTESKYRKQFQTFQKMLAANQRTIDTSCFVDDLTEKTAEYEKAAQKYRDQRNAYTAHLREEARRENVFDLLRESADRLADLRPLTASVKASETGDDELVVVLSDWHYGMKTENIWNRYNKEVFWHRCGELLTETEKIVLSVNPAVLHVVLLGDMCHGAIHTSARVESDEHVSTQLMEVSEYLADFIAHLANMVTYTDVYCTYGNHMRAVQNKKDSIHEDNFEKIIPWWLTARFDRRDDIHVINDPDNYEFIMFNACGRRFCATHGDLDSVKGSGKVLNTLFAKKFGSTIDYLILGDKHHEETLSGTGIRTIGVGSLCGTDDYGNTNRLYDTPSQTVFHLKPGKGIYATYNIELND
ncbi:MAG: metallophosphoesterase [Clostridia bacterium]|nr:metallophosphoesterase [Clostridia bacterium]